MRQRGRDAFRDERNQRYNQRLSLLDYLRNPQAHSNVGRQSAASELPRRGQPAESRAMLPRRQAPAQQQPMGPTGYMSMLDNPPPEAAPRMSFRDVSGQDARPLPDEQFDQWMSRRDPQPVGFASGGGDEFADMRPRQSSDIGAEIPEAGYGVNPATGRPFRGAAISELPARAPDGMSWEQANEMARAKMATSRRGVARPGMFASAPTQDPAIAAFMARRRPITRPE